MKQVDWTDELPTEECLDTDERVAGLLANRIARLPGDRNLKVSFFAENLPLMKLHLASQKDAPDPEREPERFASAIQKLAFSFWLNYWHSSKREKPQMTGSRDSKPLAGDNLRYMKSAEYRKRIS